MFLEIFHLSVAGLNSFAIWYDQMYVELPPPSKEIGELPLKARPIFLTVWCIVLQILYFLVSFLNDVFGTNAPRPRHPPLIRTLKDHLFSLAITLALYVAGFFWFLYAVNKDFIFPDEIESQFPVWLNHVLHTTIVPFILLELLLTNRNYPQRRAGVKLTLVFILSYMVWVFFIFFVTKTWVYPFMAMMNWGLRFAFCIVSTATAVGFYVLGEKLNDLVSPAKAVASNGHAKKH